MNERVKELVKQVGTDTSGKWVNIDNIEKLTELVVEECARYAYQNWEHGQLLGQDLRVLFGIGVKE